MSIAVYGKDILAISIKLRCPLQKLNNVKVSKILEQIYVKCHNGTDGIATLSPLWAYSMDLNNIKYRLKMAVRETVRGYSGLEYAFRTPESK